LIFYSVIRPGERSRIARLEELLPASLDEHRVVSTDLASVCMGQVRYSAVKSLWFIGMATGAMIGGVMTFSLGAFLPFVISTAIVLLFGH